MSMPILTEEPEEIMEDSTSVRRAATDNAPAEQLDGRPQRQESWSGDEWARQIIEKGSIPDVQSKLQRRIDDFRQHATPKEWNEVETSRIQMRLLLEVTRTEHDKRHPEQFGKGASIRAKVKDGWNSAAQVAFTYIQMLDVMVRQAPELVAVAYGAVKIILAVQVNSQEVKEKVPAFMKQAARRFEALEHLTAYRPERNLVTAVSLAYHLYIKFLAKAIKFYTDCRLKRVMKATIHPWNNRFQSIVDSIEAAFNDIHELAQYHGLLETHLSLQTSREALTILKDQQSNNDRMLAIIESLAQRVNVSFSKDEDIQDTAADVQQRIDEMMDQPALDSSMDHGTLPTVHGGVFNSNEEQTETMDEVLDSIFFELKEEGRSNESVRRTNAIMELPSMSHYRSRQKNLLKSEQIIARLQSRTSQLLWFDGSNMLTVTDCNMLFTNPLLLAGQGSFESTLVLRYRLQEKSSRITYVALVQALVSQALKQNPEIFPKIRPHMTRESAEDPPYLWDILLKCIKEIDASCTFVIIDAVDGLGQEDDVRLQQIEHIVDQLNRFLEDPSRLFKMLLTARLKRQVCLDSSVSPARFYSQVVRRSPTRKLSMEGLQMDMPLLSHELVRIQEGSCEYIRFNQLPYLYIPGTTIFKEEDGQLMAYAVSEISGMEPTTPGKLMPLTCRVWSVNHNGRYFTKRYFDIRIPQFHGERKISDLKYVPSGHLPNEPKHRKLLSDRGRRYWELGCGFHHVQVRKKYETIRVILDQTADPLRGESTLEETTDEFSKTDAIKVKPGLLILCPSSLDAFHLRDFQWSRVYIDDIEEITFDDDPFAKTWLEPQYVERLKALFKHEPGHQAGPGGVIGLLHGPSGAGKTLAAECTADYARMPLLPLFDNAGSETNSVSTFKRTMGTVFDLATRWNCLVLVENGEVLVERWATLRNLEQFSGYVLVTSGNLADSSIFNLEIPFGPLENQGLLWVAQMHLENYRIGKGLLGKRIDYDEAVLHDFFNRGQMTGRDAKNIIHAAVLIADRDPQNQGQKRVRITTSHLNMATGRAGHI